MPRAQMLVMMNIITPTEEAAPICPLLLANFIYIRMLLVWIELAGEPLPSVKRKGISNICMPPTSDVTKIKIKMGFKSGKVIRLNICQALAPSTMAASYNCTGMEVMPAITMIKVCPNQVHHWMKTTSPRVTETSSKYRMASGRNPARTMN